MRTLKKLLPSAVLILIGMALWPLLSLAATTADMYWLGGTSSTGAPIFIPVTAAKPLPTACL